jgi:hypothetical protein
MEVALRSRDANGGPMMLLRCGCGLTIVERNAQQPESTADDETVRASA